MIRPERETAMYVGELAKRTGASIRSLHYYEQMDVPHASRQENGYRSYTPEAIEQLGISVSKPESCTRRLGSADPK